MDGYWVDPVNQDPTVIQLEDDKEGKLVSEGGKSSPVLISTKYL